MTSAVLSAGSALLDWAFPPLCASCAVPLAPRADDFLCPDCRAFLEPVQLAGCMRCSPRTAEQPACVGCTPLPSTYASLHAPFAYRGTAGAMVRAIKFRGGEHLAHPAAALLVGASADHLAWLKSLPHPPDAVVPMPMNPWRQFRRGYNQAEALARAVVELLDWPPEPAAARRVRGAAPQARRTSAAERLANVRHVFAPGDRERLEGRCFLLIDDVITTGATAAMCAGAMLEGGAAAVHILALARAGLADSSR